MGLLEETGKMRCDKCGQEIPENEQQKAARMAEEVHTFLWENLHRHALGEIHARYGMSNVPSNFENILVKVPLCLAQIPLAKAYLVKNYFKNRERGELNP